MKVVLLAGGYGTRISEESHLRPKPMIEIGEKPILWHIMKLYSYYGFHDFVICLGYKGNYIKEYFSNFYLQASDITFDFRQDNATIVHSNNVDPWRVTLVNTGLNTMTGGRVKRVAEHIKEEPFMLTYGDGVSNVDMGALLSFHRSQGKIATVTAVKPLGRFGSLDLDDKGGVKGFMEKPKGDGSWINAGFMVFQPEMLNYIRDDDTILEAETLPLLAREGQLQAYQHQDFWQPMDTMRDKNVLEELWDSGSAPWKIW